MEYFASLSKSKLKIGLLVLVIAILLSGLIVIKCQASKLANQASKLANQASKIDKLELEVDDLSISNEMKNHQIKELNNYIEKQTVVLQEMDEYICKLNEINQDYEGVKDEIQKTVESDSAANDWYNQLIPDSLLRIFTGS